MSIFLPNPPGKLLVVLQKIMYEFVWNRKQDRISRKIAIKSIAKGGLGIPKLRLYKCTEANLGTKIKNI